MNAISEYVVTPGSRFKLSSVDPGETRLQPDGKKDAVKKSEKLLERLAALQELLYANHHHALLIVLQGMDTSGKDGAIRHVMTAFNPAGVQVASFKKPTPEELDHDYLWRIHARMPAKGEVVVFNRSHYEDVGVVRVHALVPEKEWRRRYAQINDFERTLADNGTLIVKFFLHISADEQRERLQARVDDPTKRWKFQAGDLDERKLWKDYVRAYEEAIQNTSTEWAPWYVIPSNAKWYRNWVVTKVLIDVLEDLDMKYPQPDLGKVVVV